LFKKNYTSLFSLATLLILSACSQKSPTNSGECGEGTLLQGAAAGAISGAVVSKLTKGNALTGALIAATVGGIAGNALASMQCQYSGKEQILLTKIQENIQKQNSLAKSTNQLSREMSSLNQEINKIKKEEKVTEEQKVILYSEIEEKEEALYTLQKVNDSVLHDSNTYYKTLNNANISSKDKTTMKNSLDNVLENLNSIKKASSYNLEQLQLFKTRLS
jgi:hypothetical protein